MRKARLSLLLLLVLAGCVTAPPDTPDPLAVEKAGNVLVATSDIVLHMPPTLRFEVWIGVPDCPPTSLRDCGAAAFDRRRAEPTALLRAAAAII